MMMRSSSSHGALEDAVIILLSPVGVMMGLFISPVLLLAWPAGVVMLWKSRAWTTGAKLIGTALSGVSFVWGGILGFNFEWRNGDLGSLGVVLGVTLFVLLFLLQMMPAITSVVYLWRTRGSPRPRPRQSVDNDHHR